LYYQVNRPDGVVVDGFYGTAGGANGTGQLPPVTLPVSGTYVVRVSSYYTYSGEYRIRVTTAPPIWQLESEDNNNVSQANMPTFTRGLTNQSAKVLSYIRATDPGDVFGFSWQPLGRAEVVLVLPESSQIALVLAQPATSALQPILEILNSAGTVVASAPAGNTNLTHERNSVRHRRPLFPVPAHDHGNDPQRCDSAAGRFGHVARRRHHRHQHPRPLYPHFFRGTRPRYCQ
jgi:hypothetical protein